ncbi:MAG: pilus assembly protein PilM [Phycisphaerales bacterium]|nr:pilus assembly protein PilM [Phycisphaerales bacterium]
MRLTIPRFKSKVGAIGVAFSDDEVRMLQVRECHGSLGVTGAAHSASTTAAHMSNTLRDAIVAGGFVGRRCVVSLPDRDVLLQSIQLPRMSDQELDEAIAWEASQRMGVARDSIQSDWLRTGAEDTQTAARDEVLMVATRRDVLSARLDMLVDAGLRPTAVDTTFGAIGRLFSRHHRRDADRETSRAVLHVGNDESTFLVLRGDAIAFCKRIDTGGGAFDACVAERLCLEPHAAGELRLARLRSDASAIDPATDRALREAIRPVTFDLAQQVLLCLRYASVTFRGLSPERLITTGEHGHEPALLQALGSASGVEVHVDDAKGTLGGLRQGLASILQREPSVMGAWATAAGLSVRGLHASQRSRTRRQVAA